jgi:DNA polymerase
MAAKTFQTRYAEKHPLSFCQQVIDTYRQDWAPRVPYLWYGLEEAALKTMMDGKRHNSYFFEFSLAGGWLCCLLPSGRRLWYYDPKIEVNKFGKEGITFRQNRGRKDMYGGKWAENIAQALARDIMVHAMLKVEAEGLLIVLTVHDEIVVETERQDAAVALKQIMEDGPAWAKDLGIPVAAETWQGERYRK